MTIVFQRTTRTVFRMVRMSIVTDRGGGVASGRPAVGRCIGPVTMLMLAGRMLLVGIGS